MTKGQSKPIHLCFVVILHWMRLQHHTYHVTSPRHQLGITTASPCMTSVSFFRGPSLPAAPRIPQPIWLHEDGLRGWWIWLEAVLWHRECINSTNSVIAAIACRHCLRCLGAQHRVTTYPIQPFSPNHHLSSRWCINDPTGPTCKVSTFSKFFKLLSKKLICWLLKHRRLVLWSPMLLRQASAWVVKLSRLGRVRTFKTHARNQSSLSSSNAP